MFGKLTAPTVDLLFPRRCLVCGSFDTHLCERCAGAVRIQDSQRCSVCEAPTPWGLTHPGCLNSAELDGILAAGNFKQLQYLVHAMKYQLLQDLAVPLGRILTEGVRHYGLENFFSDFIIIPVPLHAAKLRYRGFNQSALLAQTIASELALTLAPRGLERVKNTDSQSMLPKPQRLQNIRGAFACPEPEVVAGKKILLIDDLATSCATLHECAKVLKRAKAEMVWGLVLAHG